MGRGLTIALVALLVASIALNVFTAGFMVERLVGRHHGPPPVEDASRGFDSPFRLMRHAETLPPESREAFRAAIRERLPELRSDHEEMRRLRRELSALISSETWDREKIAAQMKAIRETQARQREAFDAAFLAAFETLSADDRRALMKAAQERRRRHHRHRRPPPEE